MTESKTWAAGATLLANAASVTAAAPYTGPWQRVRSGVGFNFWEYIAAAASPTVTVVLHYSIFEADDPVFPAASNYITVTLAAETTQDQWLQKNCPAALKQPFVLVRAYITTTADATVSVAMCRNQAA